MIISEKGEYDKENNDNDEEKVINNCHVTGKVRGAAHWNCNISFQLTKKVPVIFQNLEVTTVIQF